MNYQERANIVNKGGGSTQAREGDPLKDYFERNRINDEQGLDENEDSLQPVCSPQPEYNKE